MVARTSRLDARSRGRCSLIRGADGIVHLACGHAGYASDCRMQSGMREPTMLSHGQQQQKRRPTKTVLQVMFKFNFDDPLACPFVYIRQKSVYVIRASEHTRRNRNLFVLVGLAGHSLHSPSSAPRASYGPRNPVNQYPQYIRRSVCKLAGVLEGRRMVAALVIAWVLCSA